jgi:hypothetical protein
MTPAVTVATWIEGDGRPTDLPMRNTTSLIGVAALALAACGGSDDGRSNAKVSEIDWTLVSSGTTTIGHIEVGYQDDQVKDVTFRENGTAAGRLDFKYDDGKVKSIDATDVEGDRGTYAWSYSDDRLSKIVWSVPQVMSSEQKFEYDDDEGGRARRLTSTTSWAGSQPTTSVESYDYDDDGRLEEIAGVEGTSSWSWDIRYDSDSRLERVALYSGGTVYSESELGYDDEGRVDSIDVGTDTRYELSYDDDGRIEEVLVLSPNETLTVRYKYESGEVKGLTFAPNLPVAGLVDLSGKPFAQPDFVSLAAPLQLGDVPALEIASCAHDVCDVGDALGASCDSCAASVCAQDNFCCTSSWDAQCVQTAESVCGVDCGGGDVTCSHDVCTSGAALDESCGSCEAAVCGADSFCCTSSWDAQCVSSVATQCGITC